jgi:hypothetical protein
MSTAEIRRSYTRSARPSVARRRERCQAFLIAAYVELGTLAAAIAALHRLRTVHPHAYSTIVGSLLPYSSETFRKYWQTIDLERKDKARTARDNERSAGTRGPQSLSWLDDLISGFLFSDGA